MDDFLRKLFLQDIPNDKMQLAVDEYTDISIKGAYKTKGTKIQLRIK